MPDGTPLGITVVMGLLVLGTGLALARLRRSNGYTPGKRLSDRGPQSPPVVAVLVGLGLVVVGGLALVADPLILMYLALASLVVGFLLWGTYNLARTRGLPQAHSVGLSAWVFGVVLIGVVVVRLLIG